MTGSRGTRLSALGRALTMGVGLFMAYTPGLIEAQVPADAQVQEAPSLGELRDRIDARYQVLPLRIGIVLMPKYGRTTVQSIELSDGAIAVNGEPVTGAELRELVAEDAEDITRLSYMDTASRRVLFGIGPPPSDSLAAADTTGLAAADTTAEGEEDGDEEDAEFVDLDVDADAGGDQVRVGGGVHVRSGEVVDGDVVAVGGSAKVDGTVHGDVVAVGGSVELGPDAVVDGEVTAVGGVIERAPGSVIHGAVNEVAFGAPSMHFARWYGPDPFFEGVGGLIATVVFLFVLGLLTCLAYLLARRPIERMEYRVATSPWKAALVGLVAQLLFFPALAVTVVILAISIIGIPLLLLVPFALLALVIGILFGFAAVAKHVGHTAEKRFGWDHRNPYVSILVGVGIIMLISFFGSALGVGGGPLGIFATILMVIGFLVQYIAWTVGYGVLLLTRFGTRYRWGNGEAPEGTPAPLVPAPAPEPWPAGGES